MKMLAKDNMPAKMVGPKTIPAFSKFASMFELEGVASHYCPENELNAWRNNPQLSSFEDLVRKMNAGICDFEANYQWKELGSNPVNLSQNQLFTEAASLEEYINQDFSGQRLGNLIQRETVAINGSPQMSSYIAPSCEVMPTVSVAHGYNSDTPYSPANHLKYNVLEYNSMVVDRNQVGFLEGFHDYWNNPGIESTCSDSHLSQISNDILLFPERNSVATTFSERCAPITTNFNGNDFLKVQAFDDGPFYSMQDYQYSIEVPSKDSSQLPYLAQGDTNNKNISTRAFPSTFREDSKFPNTSLQVSDYAQKVFSDDTILPSNGYYGRNSTIDGLMQPEQYLEQKQWLPCLSYERHSKTFLDEAQESEFLSSVVGQTVLTNSQLPSELLQDIHVAPESSYFSSLKENASPKCSSNHFDDSFDYKILLAYGSYKNSARPSEDCIVSFVNNYLHEKLCKNQSCMCAQVCSLLSHFDNCYYADCEICGSIRNQCFTYKRHQDINYSVSSLLGDSSNTFTGRFGSWSTENMLPPAKRLKSGSFCSQNLFLSHPKKENSCSQFSSVNITSLAAPLKVQPSDPGGSLPLLESPTSINAEVLEGNVEFSRNFIIDPSCYYQKTNDPRSNCFRLKADGLHEPSKEGIVASGSEKIVAGSFSGTVNFIINNELDKLRVIDMPALCEELGTSSKKEAIAVMSNVDLAKPDIRGQKEEDVNPDTPKIRGVSLIDFFSADEIKEHISSLRQWVGQKISKEEKEKLEMHSADENTCQLCAAEKFLLAPVPIYCSSCGSRIKRSVIYYSTAEENGVRHCFCTLCYKSRGRNITFFGITIPKTKLGKRKNDGEIEEPWVQCDKCKSWQHQICALFNGKKDIEGKSEYICPKCCLEEIESREQMPVPKSTVFGAKDLPTTLLSAFLEQRLLRRLRQEKEEKAKAIGKSVDEVPGAEGLVVRVVLSVKKQLNVKKQFLDIFRDGDFPDKFSYRSKVILLFQKIEGVDICLFGMYVQEFGSDCSSPNHRCVYISYLDSVKYFRPERETATGEALRTFVYHEILIGYLEYCKKQGFAACYLWACPPLKGEDYILYSHPAIQKTPKSDKLRQWYHSMLRKAIKENVATSVTNLYDHLFIPSGQFHSKVTAARLPYFDGDYWSSAAENIINNFEKQNGEFIGRKVQKSITKRTLRALGHTNPSDDITKDVLLMQKLGQMISPVKEDFFVVSLQFVCTYCREMIISGWRWFCCQCKNFHLCERCHDVEHGLNGGDTHTISGKEKHSLSKITVNDVPSDTEDEDVIVDSWLFENRHTLLGFCQKNNYQFDTLRRAKHSSMMILHHLQNQVLSSAGSTCIICQQDTCKDDKNVCARCRSEKHGFFRIHKLAYQSSTATRETECRDETEHTDARKALLKLKELLDVLQHASLCRATKGDPCSNPYCFAMRRLFIHASNCTTRIARGCAVCIKAWKILWIHASFCRLTDCHVPRCRDLKQRMHAL
ncbi:histone acetyltransferase HAC1-like isoform X2 [Mercurialis annua]|nr:histone acetyltransferase HAC1-like isoform X2 [Mercurialis annua]XP_050228064.1 histone acetyltransferase HAC1-like isoform X2 [Mercurialis annua]